MHPGDEAGASLKYSLTETVVIGVSERGFWAMGKTFLTWPHHASPSPPSPADSACKRALPADFESPSGLLKPSIFSNHSILFISP